MTLPVVAFPPGQISTGSSSEVPGLQRLRETGDSKGFSRSLADAIEKVDSNLKAADSSTEQFVKGKAGIHEMAMSLEKADLSLRLLMRVRNRVIEAYREISRM